MEPGRAKRIAKLKGRVCGRGAAILRDVEQIGTGVLIVLRHLLKKIPGIWGTKAQARCSRNLNTRTSASAGGQRAVVAAEIAKLEHGGDRRSQIKGEISPLIPTLEKAATMLNVSRASVVNAKKGLSDGPREIKPRYPLTYVALLGSDAV